MSDPQERAVEIRKVNWRERCSQSGGCKYQAAIWITYQYGTPGRLNPGRNGLYCNAHARLALKRAKALGIDVFWHDPPDSPKACPISPDRNA
ncbi:MAG: hypothetical protein ACLQAT_19020 [Candidatus Binataceae bacterium]